MLQVQQCRQRQCTGYQGPGSRNEKLRNQWGATPSGACGCWFLTPYLICFSKAVAAAGLIFDWKSVSSNTLHGSDVMVLNH